MKKVISICLLLMFTMHTVEAKYIINLASNVINDSFPVKSHIVIIANYSHINSISQLLNNFKGKPVLIDLWATWCSPCKQEFMYSDTLHQYLAKNGIEIIYISFDKDEEDATWRNAIAEYNLSGNHIRANKALQDDLTTLIWGAKDAYSIPRYLLFDKTNRLIDNDVLAPSNGARLYQKIDEKVKFQ
jgi:thiol-disulfide isomerase/thioredoxin